MIIAGYLGHRSGPCKPRYIWVSEPLICMNTLVYILILRRKWSLTCTQAHIPPVVQVWLLTWYMKSTRSIADEYASHSLYVGRRMKPRVISWFQSLRQPKDIQAAAYSRRLRMRHPGRCDPKEPWYSWPDRKNMPPCSIMSATASLSVSNRWTLEEPRILSTVFSCLLYRTLSSCFESVLDDGAVP